MKRLTSLAVLLCLLFAACSGANKQGSETVTQTPAPSAAVVPSAEPTPSPSATPSATPQLGAVDPLTGLGMEEALTKNRPVAIMMNNLKKALPMFGVSTADIIYEAPAEGGITRMLAVWQDASKVPQIGSVRSTRAYYLDLAQGLDAILLHAGGSPEAYAEIPKRGVTALDCVNGGWEGTLFWRDKDRIKNAGFEHSVFTSGERITQALKKVKRTAHEDGYDNTLRFSDDATPGNGQSAKTITLKFSDYKTGVFEYDEKSGLYAVSEYGKPYIDGEDGSQVCVKNVLVLYAPVTTIKGDKAGRLRVDLVGQGEGYFACGGKYTAIRWSKKSYSDPFVYTKVDGSALELSRGTSYINIFPDNQQAKFE
jgi:uncharacterized protein Usg